MRCHPYFHFWPVLFWIASPRLEAAETYSPPPAVSFVRDVAPILATKCLNCHQPGKAKGGYRVHSFAAARTAGDSGHRPWDPGNSKEGEWVKRLREKDPEERMPQKDDPLPEAQIDQIERWIREGAVFDGSDPALTLDQLDLSRSHPAPPREYPRPTAILSLLLTHDMETLCVGGYHELRWVNIDSGKPVRETVNIPERVTALAWTKDAKQLVVAGGTPGKGGEVRILDPLDPSSSHVLFRSPDLILALAVSPDGRWLVAGGCDSLLRILELPSGKLVRSLEQHSDWVTAITFNASSDRFASASRDKSARVFNPVDGDFLGAYLDSGEPLQAVRFFLDSNDIISGGRDRKLTLWESTEGKAKHKPNPVDQDVLALQSSGSYLWALLGNGVIQEFSGEPGAQPKTRRTYSVESAVLTGFTISTNASVMVAGSRTGHLYRWQVGTNTQPVELGCPFPIKALAR